MAMEITWAVLLIIPMIIYVVFPSLKVSRALTLAIFFLPFASIGVFNVSTPSAAWGVGLDRFFAVVLITTVMLYAAVGKGRLERIPKNITIGFSLCCLTIAASLAMLADADGILIWKYVSGTFVSTPLALSYRNISKTVELLISAAFCVSIYQAMPFVSPRQIAKVLILSLLLMSASGFLDLLPASMSLWPMIKNNASHPREVGLIIGLFGEPRLTGLSLEPSHLVMYAAAGLSVMCGFVKNGVYITNKRLDVALLVFFALTMFLTFSPSMAVTCLFAGIYLMYGRKLLMSPKCLPYVCVMIVLAWLFDDALRETFAVLANNMLLKLGVVSGPVAPSSMRSFSYYAAWSAFKQSPVVGVGWGSLLLPIGLPILLLGSVGILGTLAFGYVILSVFKLAFRRRASSSDSTEKALRDGLILYFSIMTATCLYTKGWQYMLSLPFLFFGAAVCSKFMPPRTGPLPSTEMVRDK